MSSRILLGGPSLEELYYYAANLTLRGYDVRSATTGLGCLAILRKWQPHLLVMNPHLTWGSGVGVLCVMQEDESCPSIPIVLMVDDALRMRAELLLLDIGIRGKPHMHPARMCHLLHKPVTTDQLCDLADALLLQPDNIHELNNPVIDAPNI